MGAIAGCTCCSTCDIGSDDFTRSNGTDINTGSSVGWTEESGSWDITSNALRCTSEGIAVCNTAHSGGEATMSLSVDFKHNTAGRTIDLIVARVDSSNYFYVRFKVDGASGSVDIRKKAGGTHSSLQLVNSVTINTNTFYTGVACVDRFGRISASLNGTAIGTSDAQTVTGTTAAIGSNFSGTATFDNFVLTKTLSDTDTSCTDCDKVEALCEFCTSAARSYQIVITGIANNTCSACTNFNGTWIVDDISEDPLCALQGDSQGPCVRCVPLPATTCDATVILLFFFDLTVAGSDPTIPEVKGFSFHRTIVSTPYNCNDTFPDSGFPDKTSNGSVCTMTSATCDVTPI